MEEKKKERRKKGEKEDGSEGREKEEGSIHQLLFDTHCHLHDDTYNRHLISHVKVGALCLMGTQQSDWHVVQNLHRNDSDKIYAAFGVHPWYAHAVRQGWIEELTNYLLDNPASIVGEIGLDKAAKIPGTGRIEYDKQKEVFYEQLCIAGTLQRPVSIHCVRAYGDVMDMIKQLYIKKGIENFPTAIIMHSYGGTADMMTSYIKMKGIGDRFYFSFSKCINMRSEKTRAVIQAIPEERLLIESDQNTPTCSGKQLLSMCNIVAESRSDTVSHIATVTHTNAMRVFSF